MIEAVVDLGVTAFCVDATQLYVARSPATVDEMLTVLTAVYNPDWSGRVSTAFNIVTLSVLDTELVWFNQVIIGGGLPCAVHWKLTGDVSFTVRVAGPVTWMVGTAVTVNKDTILSLKVRTERKKMGTFFYPEPGRMMLTL